MRWLHTVDQNNTVVGSNPVSPQLTQLKELIPYILYHTHLSCAMKYEPNTDAYDWRHFWEQK